MYDLAMAYSPESAIPTLGSCHFELVTTYSNNSLDLTFQNIFFLNGYGKVVRDYHTHSGESGPNNAKELQIIINKCIKLAVQDIKDFLK